MIRLPGNLSKSNRRELCPFCFEFFRLRETPFRCMSVVKGCTPEVDRIVVDMWGETRPLGKVIPATDRYVDNAVCPGCRQMTHKRLCPHCHSKLPHSVGECDTYIFSVIGAKGAGKSHYLAVLIEQLKQIGASMNLLMEALSDETIDRYRNDFYDPLYNQGRTIDGTVSALAHMSVLRPLVYGLSVIESGLFGRQVIRKSVILVFFDTAGEDLNDEDTMSIVNKYIYRSNGIILLIDPLQLGRVRARLSSGKAHLPPVGAETSEIVDRTTRLILRGKELKMNAQIDIPLAIAFSKIDALASLVDAHFQINSASRHIGGFDAGDFDAVNGEMMSLLHEWGEEHLVNQVQVRYREHGFFGLTALGCDPGPSSTIPHVLPRRVEDPFLWLLSRNGLIRTVGR